MAKITSALLKKKYVPQVFILGILAAVALGWKTDAFNKIADFTQLKAIFPYSGTVAKVNDGDTFELKGGQRIRLIGIDAPEGVPTRAQNYLMETIYGKRVYLEYDRYQDDKFGRVLAWVWVGCESPPRFLPADYMHKSGNESMYGLKDNPKGCAKGKLINEELVRSGLATLVAYTDRGPTKYEARISIK